MDLDGLFLVDKPQKWTSHDVVDYIRRLSNWKKVGHFGSLDPLATGLLLVGTGKATRLFPVLSKLPKTYQGLIRFGWATDTYDAEGQPLAPPHSNFPKEEELIEIIKSFEGEKKQFPPPFSAKKYKGRPLYRLARRGQKAPLKPIKIKIYKFHLIHYRPPDLFFEVDCSSGTYIRSLAHDLGLAAGCWAHLAQLSRLAVGPFRLEKACSPDLIEKSFREKTIEEIILPLERVLEEQAKAILSEVGSFALTKGRALPPQAFRTIIFPPEKGCFLEIENMVRLFSPDGRFLGLARPSDQPGYLVPFLLL